MICLFYFSNINIDVIERRGIVPESFLLFNRSMATAPLKKCYGFFSEGFFDLKKTWWHFFHKLILFYMGDRENNIPLCLSFITLATNPSMYTNLYLFCWILKNFRNSGIGFLKHTHFKMTSSNTRNKHLWIHEFFAKVLEEIVIF